MGGEPLVAKAIACGGAVATVKALVRPGDLPQLLAREAEALVRRRIALFERTEPPLHVLSPASWSVLVRSEADATV